MRSGIGVWAHLDSLLRGSVGSAGWPLELCVIGGLHRIGGPLELCVIGGLHRIGGPLELCVIGGLHRIGGCSTAAGLPILPKQLDGDWRVASSRSSAAWMLAIAGSSRSAPRSARDAGFCCLYVCILLDLFMDLQWLCFQSRANTGNNQRRGQVPVRVHLAEIDRINLLVQVGNNVSDFFCHKLNSQTVEF
jgi:hypothetical protein